MSVPRRFPDLNYDEPGCCLITIVTANRLPALGRLKDGIITLSQLGRMARTAWGTIPYVRPWISVGAFVIMPDHCHGMLWWDHVPRGETSSTHVVVNGLKGSVTRAARRNRITPVTTQIWQRSYDVRFLASDVARLKAERYILDNPARAWARVQAEQHGTLQEPGSTIRGLVGRGWDGDG